MSLDFFCCELFECGGLLRGSRGANPWSSGVRSLCGAPKYRLGGSGAYTILLTNIYLKITGSLTNSIQSRQQSVIRKSGLPIEM